MLTQSNSRFVSHITPAACLVNAARGSLTSAMLRAASHKHFGSEIEWLKHRIWGYCGHFFAWQIAFIDMEIHAGNMVLIIKFICIFNIEHSFSSVIINSIFFFYSVCSNLTLTGRIISVLLLLATVWLGNLRGP